MTQTDGSGHLPIGACLPLFRECTTRRIDRTGWHRPYELKLAHPNRRLGASVDGNATGLTQFFAPAYRGGDSPDSVPVEALSPTRSRLT